MFCIPYITHGESEARIIIARLITLSVCRLDGNKSVNIFFLIITAGVVRSLPVMLMLVLVLVLAGPVLDYSLI